MKGSEVYRGPFRRAGVRFADAISELRRAIPEGDAFADELRKQLVPYSYGVGRQDSVLSLPEELRTIASGLRSIAHIVDDAADNYAREARGK